MKGKKGSSTIFCITEESKGFPGGSVVKNLPAVQEKWVQSLGQEYPLERKWQPIPLPENFHGQRSLKDCRPWGCKQSMGEQLSMHAKSRK